MLLNIPAMHKTAPAMCRIIQSKVSIVLRLRNCSRAPGDTSFEKAWIKFSFQSPLNHLFSGCFSRSL